MRRDGRIVAAAIMTLVVIYGCKDQSRQAEMQPPYWPTLEWEISSPEEQGLDADRLASIDAYAKKNLPNFTSVLLIRHGYIVYEKYSSGDENTLRRLWYVTSSITSTVLGIALNEGYIKSLDQKVIEILPELNIEGITPESKEINVKHLVTNTSGLATLSMDGPPTFEQIKSLFAMPMSSSPGKELGAAYNCPQIISQIVTRTTGKSVYEFAKGELFTPLGIKNIQWADVEVGISGGANGIFMTSRDMAKIGYLYIKNGRWESKQIVNPEWIRDSTKVQVVYKKEFKPKDRSLNIDFGYFWWVNTAARHSIFWAHGYGGQTITVVPDLDLILVITSLRSEWAESDHLILLKKVILPCIVR